MSFLGTYRDKQRAQIWRQLLPRRLNVIHEEPLGITRPGMQRADLRMATPLLRLEFTQLEYTQYFIPYQSFGIPCSPICSNEPRISAEVHDLPVPAIGSEEDLPIEQADMQWHLDVERTPWKAIVVKPKIRIVKAASPSALASPSFFAADLVPAAHIREMKWSVFPEPRISLYRPVPDITVRSLPVLPIEIGRIHQFFFQEARRERLIATASSPANTEGGTPLPRIDPPNPPPEAQSKQDLQEVLRWLLTPPIDVLLSNPELCLPDTPFGFQLHGIKWLYDRESALLADEMGLGKTMQAILAARLLWRDKQIEQILVVCPKTLIPNWRQEFVKWWPQSWAFLKVIDRDRQWYLRLGHTKGPVIKIINYEAIAREVEWLEANPVQHDLVILDEAQRIKNPGTTTARAVKLLRRRRAWALTGTPLENKTGDVMSIFEFLRPGLLKSQDPGHIRDRIAPYLLRRRTEEVLCDLPKKIDQDVEIELGSAQREAYDRAEREGVIELNDRGDEITVFHVFQLITRLRQICNFEPVAGESAKLERLRDDLEEIVDSGRKALIFSQFVNPPFGLKRLADQLPQYRSEFLHGEVSGSRRQDVVHRFAEGDEISLLLLNFQVGGVGLNLQAANYVYLFDRWWNPAVEDQAVKRAHRIGQRNTVFVRRFVCKDTIEERILQKLREKRRLFRAIIEDGRPAESMGLTEEELFSLFGDLRARPRRTSQEAVPSRVRLDAMSPAQFEELIAELYKTMGYDVQLTGGTGDQGIDVLAERKEAWGHERLAIQCKHQSANVGSPTLRDLWGVMNHDPGLTVGVLVTSTAFTADARQFAVGKRLKLIDRTALECLLKEHNVARL